MIKKKFIINADDFGLCDSVNRGILDCYHQGLVTDFSFMINDVEFDDSLKQYHNAKIESCGCHLNLTVSKSIHKNSSLTNKRGSFHGLLQQFYNIVRGHAKETDIYQEIVSQIESLRGNQINISHLDSHQNIHLIPKVFKLLVKANKDLNLNLPIRIPFETSISFNNTWPNKKRIVILNALSMVPIFIYKYSPKATTIGGNFFNNPFPKREFQRILKSGKKHNSSIFEIAVHPGYDSSELRIYDDYTAQRETELHFLKNQQTSQFNEISFISFHQLVNNQTENLWNVDKLE